MSFTESVAKAIAMATKDFTSTIADVQEYGSQLAKFAEISGIKVRDDAYAIRYRSGIQVSRSQLPEIRKAVGRVKIDGKYLQQYGDGDNVCVTLKPMSKEFDKLTFQYITPFRKGGKCKIVETSHTSRSLVCEV